MVHGLSPNTYLLRIFRAEGRERSLVVSDLRSKPKVPGPSSAASYAQ